MEIFYAATDAEDGIVGAVAFRGRLEGDHRRRLVQGDAVNQGFRPLSQGVFSLQGPDIATRTGATR